MSEKLVTRSGEEFDSMEEAVEALSSRVSRRRRVAEIIDPRAFDPRHPHQASKEDAHAKADRILALIGGGHNPPQESGGGASGRAVEDEWVVPFFEREDLTGHGVNVYTWAADDAEQALAFARRQLEWLGVPSPVYPGKPWRLDGHDDPGEFDYEAVDALEADRG